MAKEFLPIRTIMTGSAFPVGSPQRLNVEEYHRRIESGTIFGSRTDEFLPAGNKTQERIEAFFDQVKNRLDHLGSDYGLHERIHQGGDFAAIKEEAARLMWVYGIKTEIFTHDQQGLLLLGAASTNLFLRGKKGEVYARERKRIGHLTRMLANSFTFDDTSSVKVSKWLHDVREKARTEENLARKNTYETRAQLERNHTAYSDSIQSAFSFHETVVPDIDESASAEFNANYRTMPHLVRAQERLGLAEMPNIEWVITTLTREAFVKRFGAEATIKWGRIYLPSEIGSLNAREGQQHELHHILTGLSVTEHLGFSMREADAERIIDNPNRYPSELLWGYYIDDLIDSTVQPTGATNAYIVRQKAAINIKQRVFGSDEERQWNTIFLDRFGLEGYCTYYFTGAADSYPDQVKEQLLDVQTSAYRLAWYAEAYKNRNFSLLPDDLYTNKMGYREILQKSIALVSNNNGDVTPEFAFPSKLGGKYSTETLVKLSQRAHAWMQLYRRLSPQDSRFVLKLKELAWMKERYPHLYAETNSIPIDVFDPLVQQNVSFSEQEFGDIQKLIKRVIAHMGIVDDGNEVEVDNTVKYISLRLSSGEYSRDNDEELQRKMGQALATVYRRFDAMPGRINEVAVEIRSKILEAMIAEGATFTGFKDLLNIS